MKKRAFILSISAVLVASCQMDVRRSAPSGMVNQSNPPPSFPCLNAPTVSSNIPGDTVLSDQPSFNCFAWSEFIAVNWLPDTNAPASQFGTPGDLSPVVFELAHNVHDFLNPDGSAPEPTANTPHRKVLSHTAKFNPQFSNEDIEEAFPFKPPGQAWLADRDGNLVWYEVLVNDEEYNYFIEHKLYNSDNQYNAAIAGQHFDLPKGDLNGNHGAMEFKAAWLTVDNPSEARWQRYKLSTGTFCSDDGNCREQTVALVGLHIIHKTASQPSWVWATFEHVDNAPDLALINSGKAVDGFTFFNPDCQPRAIPEQCVNHQQGLQTSCAVNNHPAYSLTLEAGRATGACQPYPIQVARKFAIPDSNENPVARTNTAAQALIRAANPDSVYQYYQLVNVLWNDTPVDENQTKTLPIDSLSSTGFRPNQQTFPVANTVMETYIQDKTCIDCHSIAQIAQPPGKPATTFASDYSFVFSMAGPKKPED